MINDVEIKGVWNQIPQSKNRQLNITEPHINYIKAKVSKSIAILHKVKSLIIQKCTI